MKKQKWEKNLRNHSLFKRNGCEKNWSWRERLRREREREERKRGNRPPIILWCRRRRTLTKRRLEVTDIQVYFFVSLQCLEEVAMCVRKRDMECRVQCTSMCELRWDDSFLVSPPPLLISSSSQEVFWREKREKAVSRECDFDSNTQSVLLVSCSALCFSCVVDSKESSRLFTLLFLPFITRVKETGGGDFVWSALDSFSFRFLLLPLDVVISLFFIPCIPEKLCRRRWSLSLPLSHSCLSLRQSVCDPSVDDFVLTVSVVWRLISFFFTVSHIFLKRERERNFASSSHFPSSLSHHQVLTPSVFPLNQKYLSRKKLESDQPSFIEWVKRQKRSERLNNN